MNCEKKVNVNRNLNIKIPECACEEVTSVFITKFSNLKNIKINKKYFLIKCK